MCIFSQSIERVSNTNIFARATLRGTQILVYSMTLGASRELAMVLPLPTVSRAPEDAVRFVDLEGYPTYFDDMRKGFPEPQAQVSRAGGLVAGSAPTPMLRVHDVGAFEASFVPTLADFERLDPRFRLPPSTWDAMATYRDWGFAVFKLKGFGRAEAPRPGFFARLFGATPPPPRDDAAAPSTVKSIHPMAFELRPRDRGKLFFPTVHVHDGVVHETASFDHTLYCQVPEEVAPRLTEWRRSDRAVASFMNGDKAKDTLSLADVAHRRRLVGPLPNRDQWVVIE